MQLHCDICEQEVGHYLHDNPRIGYMEYTKHSSLPDIICCLCFGNEERTKFYRQNPPFGKPNKKWIEDSYHNNLPLTK